MIIHPISEYKAQRLALLIIIVFQSLDGLSNNVSLTPPMGWLAWERFKCNIDCYNYPTDCISENLFMEMADHLVKDGYRDAGYNRINIDDCWMQHQRNSNGRLQYDLNRFPNGIKALSEFMHSRGLKLGIYGDYGTKTCMGYPGTWNTIQLDANTFAEWKVDMLKLDGCNSKLELMDKGYPEMQKFLNRTNRPILFSCSWPYYQMLFDLQPNYQLIIQNCNTWRNFHDITDSWSSIKSVIDFYGNNQEVLVPIAGPDHWNDPDMLLIGNKGLTYDQSKVQMGIWAVLAAPLLMSNDLRSIAPELKEILLNKEVIAVNQDHLGIQGKRILTMTKEKIEIWARPISPVCKDLYSFAIAIVNVSEQEEKQVTLKLEQIGLSYKNGYHVQDLFSGHNFHLMYPSTIFSVTIKPTGLVLLRAELDLNKNS